MLTLKDVQRIKMKIVKAAPPNAKAIERVFPGVTSGIRPVFFCYGDTIYNPAGVTIPLELLAHEAVHSLQQEVQGVQVWWDLYLASTHFRFNQELEAHRVEYEQYRAFNNRAFSRRYVSSIAERLSGPLYGGLGSKATAKRLILANQLGGKHVTQQTTS